MCGALAPFSSIVTHECLIFFITMSIAHLVKILIRIKVRRNILSSLIYLTWIIYMDDLSYHYMVINE